MSRGRDPALPPLLPRPRHARARGAAFALEDDLPVVLQPGAGSAEFAAARALRDAVRAACGIELAVEGHARSEDLGRRIELERETDEGEAYRLSVDAALVRITGTGPAGVRYGVETLIQLLPTGSARGRRGTPRIPGCEIEDAPELAVRGIMLDVSRGKVPRFEALCEIVDLCVRLKLNALMLYVEHTFRFRRHPRIGAGASPLDAETLRALDAYAAARHVELVPSLQSLGHMERILGLSAYAHLAETPRGWSVSPAHPGSYELLADLYAEFLPNFRSRWFNANCDEPFDLEGGPSAARARELGPGGVYLEHVRRVRDLAREHGKRTLIWGDVVHSHPERIPEIDRDLILLDWWYEAECDYDRVTRFAENGIEFLVCPGTSSWNCLFPRLANSVANIARWADAARRHGARGLLVTDWGDFGHYNLQGNSLYAFAFAAQQAWSGELAAPEFERAFSRSLFGDERGETGRLYRELGAIHDAGFRIFNGSALQFLFFDDLDEAFFVQGARAARLRASARALERVRARLSRARPGFAADPLTGAELGYAADASLHACRKALAGLEYLAWRRRPARFDAAGRRRLARRLAALAAEQRQLVLRLRRLWLARSHPSEFEITGRRLERAVSSLRRAARALERNRPPAPPPPHPGFTVPEVFRRLREASVRRSGSHGRGVAPAAGARRRESRSDRW